MHGCAPGRPSSKAIWAIARGAQSTLSRQTLDLQSENTQIKEELAFLQQLFSDSGKQGAISIQRLSAERASDDSYRFSLLIVRGGKPTDEFSGRLEHAGESGGQERTDDHRAA